MAPWPGRLLYYIILYYTILYYVLLAFATS